MPFETYPYKPSLGRAGGPVRNADMIERGLRYREEGDMVFVLHFPGNAGTKSCVTIAERKGLATLSALRLMETDESYRMRIGLLPEGWAESLAT